MEHQETSTNTDQREPGLSGAAGSAWLEIEWRLPPLEEPVWLYLPDIGQPIIGVRTLDDGAWYWARCYGDFYFSRKMPVSGVPGWMTDTADMDDIKPSHWQPLPLPPNAVHEPQARQKTPDKNSL